MSAFPQQQQQFSGFNNPYMMSQRQMLQQGANDYRNPQQGQQQQGQDMMGWLMNMLQQGQGQSPYSDSQNQQLQQLYQSAQSMPNTPETAQWYQQQAGQIPGLNAIDQQRSQQRLQQGPNPANYSWRDGLSPQEQDQRTQQAQAWRQPIPGQQQGRGGPTYAQQRQGTGGPPQSMMNFQGQGSSDMSNFINQRGVGGLMDMFNSMGQPRSTGQRIQRGPRRIGSPKGNSRQPQRAY